MPEDPLASPDADGPASADLDVPAWHTSPAKLAGAAIERTRYAAVWLALAAPAQAVLPAPAAWGQEGGPALTHPDVGNAARSRFSTGGAGNRFLVVDGISDRAFIDLAGKWPTDPDGVTRIPVCWVQPRPEHEEQRRIVASSVQGTWQLLSSIQFQNWSACTSADTHAVKISVGDHWPSTSHVGVDAQGRPPSMELNFDFENPAQWRDCRSTPEACIRKVAVHEFGHALAFMHEQTRPDTPDTCLSVQKGEGKVPPGTPGYTTGGTPWDSDSVMNYCNPVWNNAGNLSPNDVLALQSVYGAPRR